MREPGFPQVESFVVQIHEEKRLLSLVFRFRRRCRSLDSFF